MEQIGWSLVDAGGNELSYWGDIAGQTMGIPDMIRLPSGDDVHCPSPATDYQGCKLLPRMLQYGDAAGIKVSADSVLVTRAAPVPQIISDRQFYHQLATQGIITADEALAAVGPGTLPAALITLVNSLPSEQQFSARMLFVGATQFDRGHPMVGLIGAALGWTSEQIDALWIAAAKL